MNETIKFLTMWRHSVGITQTEVGKALGVSRSTISAIECGDQSVSYDMIFRWAEAIGLKPILKFEVNPEKYEILTRDKGNNGQA